MANRSKLTASAARWSYGLWAVLAGVSAIVVCYIVAAIVYSEAGDAATAFAPVATAIGTLVGAYFGVQVGAAGKEESDAARDAAQKQAMQFAAIADPEKAMWLLGGPTPGGGGGGGPAESVDLPGNEREAPRGLGVGGPHTSEPPTVTPSGAAGSADAHGTRSRPDPPELPKEMTAGSVPDSI